MNVNIESAILATVVRARESLESFVGFSRKRTTGLYMVTEVIGALSVLETMLDNVEDEKENYNCPIASVDKEITRALKEEDDIAKGKVEIENSSFTKEEESKERKEIKTIVAELIPPWSFNFTKEEFEDSLESMKNLCDLRDTNCVDYQIALDCMEFVKKTFLTEKK